MTLPFGAHLQIARSRKGHETSNPSFERTAASALRLLAVPSSLRSSAAGYARLYGANPTVVTFIADSPSLRLVTNAPPIWHIRCRPSRGSPSHSLGNRSFDALRRTNRPGNARQCVRFLL